MATPFTQRGASMATDRDFTDEKVSVSKALKCRRYRDALEMANHHKMAVVARVGCPTAIPPFEGADAASIDPSGALRYDYLLWQSVVVHCYVYLKEYEEAHETLLTIQPFNALRWTHNTVRYKVKDTQIADREVSIRVSLVPFALRMVGAQLPHLTGDRTSAIDRHYSLLHRYKTLLLFLGAAGNALHEAFVESMDGEVDIDSDVYHHLEPELRAHTPVGFVWPHASIAVRRMVKHRFIVVAHNLALVLKAKNLPQVALDVLELEVLVLFPNHKPTISLMGRISLQMGCCAAAQEYFTKLGGDKSLPMSDCPKDLSPDEGHESTAAEDEELFAVVATDLSSNMITMRL
eukprot:GHVN01096936.1.p2 GENE.GHVN01096936.1~~GHVN01096936.1.p2  ORF type:complete len:391 (-),score=58.59 GHVN01096936.1:3172-4215(-)